MNVLKCKFSTTYESFNDGIFEDAEFTCDEDASENGLCKFHDEDFVVHYPSEVRDLIIKKIDDGLHNSQDLYFIGYNIPEIKLTRYFDNQIYFDKCKFHGQTDFSRSIFEKRISFNESSFDIAIFQKVKFETVEFVNVKFVQCFFTGCEMAYAVFTSSKFKHAMFHKCRFGTVFFAATKFEIADFPANYFNNHVSFYESILTKSDFINSTFHDAEFSKSTIKEANFSGATFSSADFTDAKFEGNSNFKKVLFTNQENVIFTGNLSNVSFVDTNVSRVRFTTDVIWGGDDNFTIIDERILRANPKNMRLGTILSIYRHLRENYEYRLRYEEAGKFFIKEMDLKREYVEIPKKEQFTTQRRSVWQRYFSLSSFYSYLCRYGESFQRIIIHLIGTFAVFASLYWIFQTNDNDLLNITMQDKLFYTFENFMRALSQAEGTSWIDYLFKITLIPILGSLFIVLRRRFERRFRH